VSRHRRKIRSSNRGPAAALTLLFGLMRIGLPLLLIAGAAYLFLNMSYSGTGMIRVTTSIPGADIYIGGVQTGALSDTTFKISAGRQIVTVRKGEYISDPEFVVVNVNRRELSRASFVLRKAQEAIARDTVTPLRPVRQDIFSTGQPVRSISPGARPSHRLVDFGSREETPDRPVPSVPVPKEEAPLPLPSSADVSSGPLNNTQITVSSTPDGADILVNGQPSSHATPYTFRGLDRGLYSFGVHKDGYIATPDNISVTLTTDFQRELAAFELHPDLSLPQPTLTVSTTPLAAGIRVDGKAAGVGKANVTPGFGNHRVEFADVPGYKTPAPVTVSLTAQEPHAEASGTYERLSGNAYIAVLPSEDMEKFDGKQLRIYVDNELILDGPKQSFDATLLGHLLAGKRLVRIQYGDLTNDTFLNLMDNEVIELTFRVESFFSKRSLKLREKPVTPIEQWEQRAQKLNVLSVT
jgi:hypothetical protein